MITKDLGMVTAYAYAVSKGYTGTEEEFAELMASYASVAQEAVDAALAAAQSEQNAQDAKTAAEGARDTAQNTVDGAIAGIQAEGQTQIGAVQSEGATQVGNVNSAGQTQVGNVNAAGTTQVGNVNTAGSTQVGAVQAKGTEVLNSIPADYSTLSGDVSGLKSAIVNETLFTSVDYNPFYTSNWSVGYINPTNGNNASLSKYIRLNPNNFINPQDGATYLKANAGYSFYVFAYEQNGTYLGAWNGKEFVKTWQYMNVTEFNLLKIETLYKYRVFMGRDDQADMTVSEYTNLIIYYTRTASDGYRGMMRDANLADDTTKASGYLTTTGDIADADEQSRRDTTTDFIHVNGGETYTIALYTHKSVEFSCRICEYDENKNYVTRFDYTQSTIVKTWRDFNYALWQITIPENVSYIRVSQRYGFCMIAKGITEWDYMPSPFDIRNHWNMRPKQDYFVKTVNHRGYGRIAPENTAPAFELSADLGFWGVENDIRFTSDGVPVLLHDETINRTARNADGTEISGDVYISQITYEQALTYDFGIWMGEQYKGTKIMTFEQFVSLCRKKSLNMYNEIKAGTEQQVADLVQLVKRYGMKKHCTWCSFSPSYLEMVCRYDESARIGLTLSTLEMSDIPTLVSLKNGFNSVYVAVHINQNSSITNEIVDALIAEDIELEMYTPNFISVMQSLNPYVTGVTSDWLIAGNVLYTGRNDVIVLN